MKSVYISSFAQFIYRRKKLRRFGFFMSGRVAKNHICCMAFISFMALLVIMPGVAFAQQRLSVTASIANMRSGPGTKYDVLWQVEQYHPVKVVQKKGNWYKIKDFENDMAWIHKSLLGNVQSVITIKEKCNVRSGPSTKSSLLFTVEKGVPFKVLLKKGNWYKIEHADGDSGWIFNTLVW